MHIVLHIHIYIYTYMYLSLSLYIYIYIYAYYCNTKYVISLSNNSKSSRPTPCCTSAPTAPWSSCPASRSASTLSLYVCVYVCMYVCMYVYIYIYIYVCMYIYILYSYNISEHTYDSQMLRIFFTSQGGYATHNILRALRFLIFDVDIHIRNILQAS